MFVERGLAARIDRAEARLSQGVARRWMRQDGRGLVAPLAGCLAAASRWTSGRLSDEQAHRLRLRLRGLRAHAQLRLLPRAHRQRAREGRASLPLCGAATLPTPHRRGVQGAERQGRFELDSDGIRYGLQPFRCISLRSPGAPLGGCQGVAELDDTANRHCPAPRLLMDEGADAAGSSPARASSTSSDQSDLIAASIALLSEALS
jgi:hypothetical protein